MTKITKCSVDAATPADNKFFLWDEELKGFGLRVYSSGRKMYLVQYHASGRLRRVNIGLHGPMTPEIARREAMRHLFGVRQALSRGSCRAALQGIDLSRVRAFHHPVHRPEIRQPPHHRHHPADVVGLHQAMKHIPYQANRTLGVLSAMFTVAHSWEVRTDGVNPCCAPEDRSGPLRGGCRLRCRGAGIGAAGQGGRRGKRRSMIRPLIVTQNDAISCQTEWSL